jgi:hypothetical protein
LFYDETGIKLHRFNSIPKLIKDMTNLIKYLDDEEIPWFGGAISFKTLLPNDKLGKVGFIKIDETFIIVTVLNINGTISKKEYLILMKKDKL